mgnify:FL=1
MIALNDFFFLYVTSTITIPLSSHYSYRDYTIVCYHIAMTRPELSIIIPAYNCADDILRMIDSIKAQDYSDYELIIVNDHSTDDTTKVLSRLSRSDRRIVAINQPANGGASVARNTGISRAKGKYLMFLDADDTLKKRALAKFISAIKSNQAQLAVSGFTIITRRNKHELSKVDVCSEPLPSRQTNEPWKIYILRLLGIDGRLYQVWNKIYLTSLIKEHHLTFQSGVNFGEDLLFNLDYLSLISHISFIPAPLYNYYQSLDGGTFSKSSLVYQNRLDNFTALEKFLADTPSGEPRDSLLRWIKYSWIYSHLLATYSADLPKSTKLGMIRQIHQVDGQAPLSHPSVIGRRKVRLERTIRHLIRHPRLALFSISLSNTVKYHRLTTGLWHKLKRKL